MGCTLAEYPASRAASSTDRKVLLGPKCGDPVVIAPMIADQRVTSAHAAVLGRYPDR